MRYFHNIYTLMLLFIMIFLPFGLDAASAGDEKTVYSSATEYDYPPFSVTDGGKADGFSVDLLKAVAKEMGFDVTFKIDQWAILKDELKNGELDILPLVGYTPERDEDYDFTVPYIVMRGNIFVREDNRSIKSQEDLFGRRVLVLDGDNSQEWAWSIGLDSELTVTSTYLEAFELLSDGAYDAVLAQGLVGEKLIRDNGLDTIVPVYIYEDSGVAKRKLNLEGYEQKFCFAVVENDSELLSLLNEGLAIVSANGTYDELYQKWFPFLLEPKEISVTESIRYLVYILFPVLVILVTAYFVATRHTIQLRTKEILQEKERSEKFLNDLVLAGKVFETSIENAPIPIMIYAEDGTLVNISKTLMRLTQYEKDDIQTIYDWVEKAYGQNRQKAQDLLTRVRTLDKTEHDGEFEVTTKDGRTLIWDFYSTYIGDLPDSRAIVMSTAVDITKRNQMVLQLKESEKRFKILHNASFGGIAVHDRGLILECNQGLSDITGYSIDELVGMDGLLLIDPDYRSLVMEKINSGNEEMYEVYGVRKNLERYPLKLEARNIPHNGKKVRAVEFRDITEFKLIEQERIRNENKLSHMKDLLSYIVEHNNNGVAVHDRDLKYIYVSKKYLEQYHIDEDVIGRHHYDVFPDLPQKWRDVHQRALRGETSHSEKDFYERKDGSIEWTRWECRPWFESDGTIGGIIVYTEIITDQVKLLENLKEKENNLRIAQEIAHVGSFDYDLASRTLDCSDEFLRIFGITAKEFFGKTETIVQCVHPDDRAYGLEISNRAFNEKKIMRSELRILRLDGDERVVDYRVGPVMDQEGACVRMTGTIQDITERKKSESELIYLSYHDSLTGLHNRRYFENKLKEIDREKKLPITVAMTDINGLKRINDSYGHEQGDKVLISAAQTFQRCCRENDIIARLGGDEFGFILPQTDADEAGEIFKSIWDCWPGKNTPLMPDSVTFGLSVKNSNDKELSSHVSIAENDLFKNKLYEVTSIRHDLIDIIMNALYEKSNREMMHSKRVSVLCGLIASEMGMSREEISKMRIAGLVHDIGKIGTNEKVLNKNGKLDPHEWSEIRNHPEAGSRILASNANFSDIANYILHHHERWDGKGYPEGLCGEEIPVESRIIALADAFDAMTSDRSYRKGMTIEQAIVEIENNSGNQFDDNIAELFLQKIIHRLNKSSEYGEFV